MAIGALLKLDWSSDMSKSQLLESRSSVSLSEKAREPRDRGERMG